MVPRTISYPGSNISMSISWSYYENSNLSQTWASIIDHKQNGTGHCKIAIDNDSNYMKVIFIQYNLADPECLEKAAEFINGNISWNLKS